MRIHRIPGIMTDVMKLETALNSDPRPGLRSDSVSPIGLAAVVTAFHVAVLTCRVEKRRTLKPVTVLIRPASTGTRVPTPDRTAPSRPVQTFSAGQLRLDTGMAVITLARWLHVMHTNGGHDH